ncbi:MAG: glycosyltransferase family 4 protein, partial [Solirubrobacterales bacterium]|nr:glycosyltransferase family 4 protein [Solirubrobacterales bacterium]
MRVLSIGAMYPPHALGGYEVTWRSSTHWLRRTGHEVRVLASDVRFAEAEGPEDDDVHRELRWYWRDHAFPPTTFRERLRLERRNATVLERHLADLRPHAVMWWAMGGMSLSLVEQVRRVGLPAVAMVGDNWPGYGPRVDAWTATWRRRPRFAGVAERLTGVPASVDLDRAATWVFVSAWTRRRARESGGWAFPGALVEPAGVDLHTFPASDPPPWSWSLAYIGRIDERKGIATAVEALAGIPESSLRVVGGGDDAYLVQLRELAARLGVADRIDFAGSRPREALAGEYANADAVLFPVTWPEPWGMVPLEAMAVGRPVVATGTGGSGEYLRDGDNALLHRPKDVTGLVAALRRLA